MLRVLGIRENMGGAAAFDAGLAAQLGLAVRRLARPFVLMLLMLALMRAELLFGCAPMAAALLAAGLAAGESPAALVLGCLLGMLRLPLTSLSPLPAACCAAVLLGELLLSLLPKTGRVAPETRICALAGFAVLIPALVKAGGAVQDSLQALACAAIAATSAPFLLPVLQLRRGRRCFMLQERVGAVLLAGACIAGLNQMLPPLAGFASALASLAVPGAATGVLCALAMAAGGGGFASLAPLSIGAMAAGWRLLRARWQRSAALLGMHAAFWLNAQASPLAMLAVILAALAYLALPEAWLAWLRRLLKPASEAACDPDRISQELSAQSRQRLRALGDAFGDMAQSCAAPTNVPSEQELICEMRSRLCTDCPSYGACWTGEDNHAVRFLCQLITEALDRVDAPPGMRMLFGDGEIPPDVLRICRRGRLIPDRLGLLLRDFAQKRRSEIKRCATGQLLSVQLTQAREILYDLAEKQAAPVSFAGPRLEQLRAALDCAGLGDCEAAALGLENVEIRLRREAAWSREELARASAAFARAFGGGFTPEMQGDALIFAQHPRLCVDMGVSCQSGVAGQVSGDSHLVRLLDRSRMALLLSDGMGSGEAAAGESAETLRLLWRFLCAGISRPLALEAVNQQMLLRSQEDMFATVDLCLIDLNTGVAELSKLAACRTLILRDGEVLRVEGGRLPLGILDQVQPAVSRIRLHPDDLLVMGSDGVMECGDLLLIERLLRQNASMEPEQLAGLLLREVSHRRTPDRSDDMTCICARIRSAQRCSRRKTG